MAREDYQRNKEHDWKFEEKVVTHRLRRWIYHCDICGSYCFFELNLDFEYRAPFEGIFNRGFGKLPKCNHTHQTWWMETPKCSRVVMEKALE
jgi:hypothetical protein